MVSPLIGVFEHDAFLLRVGAGEDSIVAAKNNLAQSSADLDDTKSLRNSS